MAKSTWKDYLTFSKGERISLYILIAVLAISICGPYYYSIKFSAPAIDTALQKQLDSLLNQDVQDSTVSNSTGNRTRSSGDSGSTIKLFYFDPNQLDAAGFKQLGLRDKTIQTIINYRSKGGYFKKPEDIRKIYGLRNEEADRIIPYIKIDNAVSKKSDVVAYQPQKEKPKQVSKKIDINTATEEDFKALPGIGDVLSKRIVKFRNSIHGFKSVNDISKTYGLSDSTFQLILPYLTITESNQ